MFLPLQRVFVGIGWTDKRRTIDVDCVCASYSKGQLNRSHSVSFHNLRNPRKQVSNGKRGKTQASTIVHTGDVLTGQKGGKDIIDQERIYMYLSEIDSMIDAMALEANVYTSGASCADLQDAYVRVVNADTNQELCRITLAQGSAFYNGTTVVCGRIFRVASQGANQWQFCATCEPGTVELLKMGDYNGTMLPPAFAAPMGTTTTVQQISSTTETKKKGGGSAMAWACVPIAVAGVVGIGAAVAIFACTDLSADMMASSIFEGCADFGVFVGEGVVAGAEFIGEGAVIAGEGIAEGAEVVGEGLGAAGEAVGEGFVDAGEATGTCCCACFENIGECGEGFGECCCSLFEGLGGLLD